MAPHFESPWWALSLLLLVGALLVAWRKRPPTLRISSVMLFERPAYSARHWWWSPRTPLLLYLVGGLLLIIALMRPQKGIERIVERREGVDIVLALDVSGSMRQYDVPANITSERQVRDAVESGQLKSRIDVAKAELRAFVKARESDRIGMIAFAKYAYVVCPPTLDHRFLLQNLQRLEAGELPDGTGIAAPLTSGVNRLKESSAKRRVLVLFTDGDNNVETSVAPRQAARIAETFDVLIHTVGVGSRRSIVVRDTPYGRLLGAGEGGFNQKLLRDLADLTGGRHFEARNAEGFKHVMDEIDKLEPTTMEQNVYVDYRERFLPVLVAGTALIVLGFLLENSVLQNLP